MARTMADALAVVLGGRVELSPGSRQWGVEWTRPDGRFVSIESGGAYLYADEAAYRAFQSGAEYEVSPVIDGAEWDQWGSAEWAEGLACIIGGHEVIAGGCEWLAGIEMPDGRYVAIGRESASVYTSRADYESGGHGGFHHEF